MIHISDLHFGQTGADERLKKLVGFILSNETPCVIHVTGDVTDNAQPWEFREALAVLKPLVAAGFVLIVSPGNHDCGPRGVLWLLNSVKQFDKFLDELTGACVAFDQYPYTYIIDDIAHIAVNTNMPEVYLARGNVGYLQRMRLFEEVQRHKRDGRKVVVSMHHHPIIHNKTLLLSDAEELLNGLAHRCDVMLFGHKHEPGEWSGSYGIDRIFAADKTPESGRYRKIDPVSGVFEWVRFI
jgi:3',5'-cyclic AMP phosphodiesterase CpdA